MKIHVLLKKEELDAQRLAGKIVVVLDVLFATTSIVTAIRCGRSSTRSASASESCAAFVAEYGPRYGTPRRAAADETIMI